MGQHLLPAGVDARLGIAWRRLARRSAAADAFAVATTDLGSMYTVVGAATVLLAARRTRLAVRVLAAGSGGWVVGQATKRLFMRARPYEAHPDVVERLIRRPTGSSFPSGHAAVAAAIGVVLADAAPTPARKLPWRALAVWVPLTRVHLGVHFPGDVLGGALLGWGVGRLVVSCGRRPPGPAARRRPGRRRRTRSP